MSASSNILNSNDVNTCFGTDKSPSSSFYG